MSRLDPVGRFCGHKWEAVLRKDRYLSRLSEWLLPYEAGFPPWWSSEYYFIQKSVTWEMTYIDCVNWNKCVYLFHFIWVTKTEFYLEEQNVEDKNTYKLHHSFNRLWNETELIMKCNGEISVHEHAMLLIRVKIKLYNTDSCIYYSPSTYAVMSFCLISSIGLKTRMCVAAMFKTRFFYLKLTFCYIFSV